jgi:1-deoxy-D-xylulose-5-phosphate reductoisomerase
MAAGGAAPCVLNGANEISVASFLEGQIGFTQIAEINEAVMNRLGAAPVPNSLADVAALDLEARELATARARSQRSRQG